MPLVESDTRVGYDTLGINGRARSTAMGVLIEHNITLVFHEEGQKKGQTTTRPVDENAKRDTDLAGADGLDDGGPAARRRVQS